MTAVFAGVTAPVLVAHQGGWDEMLMVLTPVAVFVLLLWMANNRANRARDQRAAAEPVGTLQNVSTPAIAAESD